MNWPHLLLGVSGRVSRGPWWLASVILGAIEALISMAVDRFDFGAVAKSLGGFVALTIEIVLALAALLVTYSVFAVAVKRLHDRNMRGWWALLFLLTPIVLPSVVSALAEELGPILVYAMWAAVVLIILWAILELGVRPGTPGPNRYGPDPLAKKAG